MKVFLFIWNGLNVYFAMNGLRGIHCNNSYACMYEYVLIV